ncbi:hypothetical protein RB213_000334, partial [Colletotrichum asianum]
QKLDDESIGVPPAPIGRTDGVTPVLGVGGRSLWGGQTQSRQTEARLSEHGKDNTRPCPIVVIVISVVPVVIRLRPPSPSSVSVVRCSVEVEYEYLSSETTTGQQSDYPN